MRTYAFFPFCWWNNAIRRLLITHTIMVNAIIELATLLDASRKAIHSSYFMHGQVGAKCNYEWMVVIQSEQIRPKYVIINRNRFYLLFARMFKRDLRARRGKCSGEVGYAGQYIRASPQGSTHSWALFHQHLACTVDPADWA